MLRRLLGQGRLLGLMGVETRNTSLPETPERSKRCSEDPVARRRMRGRPGRCTPHAVPDETGSMAVALAATGTMACEGGQVDALLTPSQTRPAP